MSDDATNESPVPATSAAAEVAAAVDADNLIILRTLAVNSGAVSSADRAADRDPQ